MRMESFPIGPVLPDDASTGQRGIDERPIVRAIPGDQGEMGDPGFDGRRGPPGCKGAMGRDGWSSHDGYC